VKLFINYDETFERKEKDNHKKLVGIVLIFALLEQFLSDVEFPSEVEKWQRKTVNMRK